MGITNQSDRDEIREQLVGIISRGESENLNNVLVPLETLKDIHRGVTKIRGERDEALGDNEAMRGALEKLCNYSENVCGNGNPHRNAVRLLSHPHPGQSLLDRLAKAEGDVREFKTRVLQLVFEMSRWGRTPPNDGVPQTHMVVMEAARKAVADHDAGDLAQPRCDAGEIHAASQIIQESRASHLSWIEWYRKHPEDEAKYDETCGNTAYQQKCIDGYNKVLAVLQRVAIDAEEVRRLREVYEATFPEYKRLREVAAKQMTKDGVPVVIGTTQLWWNDPLGRGPHALGVCFCISIGVEGETEPWAHCYNADAKRLCECYSTHSAALAASQSDSAKGRNAQGE